MTEAREILASSAEPRSTIRLSGPESLWSYQLPALPQRCRHEYPDIRLVFQPQSSSELLSSIRQGDLDVAFLLERPQDGTGLSGEPLMIEPLVIVAPADHRLSGTTTLSLNELSRESILVTEPGCTSRASFLDALADAGVRPNAALEFGSVEAIKQCVLAGMGITMPPVFAVQSEIAERRLPPLP